jgi:hypothetical protein
MGIIDEEKLNLLMGQDEYMNESDLENINS